MADELELLGRSLVQIHDILQRKDGENWEDYEYMDRGEQIPSAVEKVRSNPGKWRIVGNGNLIALNTHEYGVVRVN